MMDFPGWLVTLETRAIPGPLEKRASKVQQGLQDLKALGVFLGSRASPDHQDSRESRAVRDPLADQESQDATEPRGTPGTLVFLGSQDLQACRVFQDHKVPRESPSSSPSLWMSKENQDHKDKMETWGRMEVLVHQACRDRRGLQDVLELQGFQGYQERRVRKVPVR